MTANVKTTNHPKKSVTKDKENNAYQTNQIKQTHKDNHKYTLGETSKERQQNR